MTLKEIKALPDPVDSFAIGDTRKKLKELRKKIIGVANALAIRKGSAGSCNCN